MADLQLRENEKKALSELKRALTAKLNILDFRLYGSKARGTSTPDSDIDVMIVVDEYSPEVESLIDDFVFETNLAHDCFISTVIFSKEEIENGPLSESPLYKIIEKEGVKI